MAQTASKKKKPKAIDEYNKQSLLIQRLVWLYYLGEKTHNAEGLSPEGVIGGTTDYAIAGNVKQYIEARNFGYSAKKACQIALDLHKEGEVIEEVPEIQSKDEALQQQINPAPDQPPAGRDFIKTAFEIEVEEDSDTEYEAETSTPKKRKSKSIIKKSAPTMPTPTVDEITNGVARVNLARQASISMPVVWGHYEYNTYTDQRKEVMVYKYRFLTHNFLDANDIDQLWVDERTLQVRIASPVWWENPENQAMFETKEQEAVMTGTDGNPIAVTVKVPLYDLQHKLIGSMMTNNENRKDDDGRIYDTGIFKFGCNMDTADSETHVELKPLTILGVTGQFISIRVQVDYKTVVTAKKTPSKAKKATEDASIGIGPTGKSIDPDGMKVGEGRGGEDKQAAFDDDAYDQFTELYEKYDSVLPSKEKLKNFSGVERDLYFLVSFLLENDRELLESGDFVEQVMGQYEGRPEDMMKYVEGYISGGDYDDDDDEEIEDIEPSPAGSPPLQLEPPVLQIAGGSPPPALIENGVDMDTTRDEKKRRHHMTRQHSKTQVVDENN